MVRIITLAILAGVGGALAGCGGGTAATGGAAPARGAITSSTRLAIRDFAFHQQTITVAQGATVTWTNQDSSTHTVTADDRSFTSGPLAQGRTFRHTFRGPGTYAYHCEIHQYMTGTVVVTG